MVLNTSLRLCKILKSIQNEWISKYWRKLHFFNVDLAGDISLRMDTPRYQKQQFAHILLHSRSKKFSKIHRNAPGPESLLYLQPPTSLEKRRRDIYLSVSFVKFFRDTLITENLLQTGFESRILRKMVNRHSYYNKKISWSRQLFQKTDIARNSVYLRTIDRKLTLNLIIIFSPFTDICLLKYVIKLK